MASEPLHTEKQRKERHVVERLDRIRVGRGASRACFLIGGLLFLVTYAVISYFPVLPHVVIKFMVLACVGLTLVGFTLGVAFAFTRCPQCGKYFFQRRVFRANYFFYANSCQNCGLPLREK